MNNKEFVEGINIIFEHLDDNEHDFYAEHDQFWFGDVDIIKDEEVKDKLKELGWFKSEESWSCWT